MAVDVALNTPLAEALSNAVQTKLMDTGWASGGLDDSALGEYIMLMLVNGKTSDQISAELSADLLSLPPEDTGPAEFTAWLFEQVDILNSQLNGPSHQQDGSTSRASGDMGASIRGAASKHLGAGVDGDLDMREANEDQKDSTIPTGPKSMRSSSKFNVPSKRMMGQVNKAMDRSSEGALHRIRSQQGTERINTHNRQPPTGPRNDINRPNRSPFNGRPTANTNSRPNGGTAAPAMQMSPQQQMQLMAMLEQQAQMMAQIMPQQMPGAFNPTLNQPGGQPPGRSLFDRVESHAHRRDHGLNQRNGGRHPHHNGAITSPEGGRSNSVGDPDSSMEVETSQPSELSPDTVCRYNLKCTKKDCPYAHQSPAAPPDTMIDVHDVCPFGAACKNRKCVARHPSPYQKVAHASEQDCKFYPNCTNVNCPFRHPTMPMCRNGADCSQEGCRFTHVKITCKYNPCLNPDCVYKHAEGQRRGKYGDKVWTADQQKDHVSERKFIGDDDGDEELIRPTSNMDDQGQGSQHSAELVT